MKIISAFLLFILAAATAYSQNDARIIAEVAASNDKAVKNAPFSAEGVSESVQVLADGNRITRTSNSKLYRNSEGRFRREYSGGSGGFLDMHYGLGQAISITDPVAGQRVMLDEQGKTARVLRFEGGQNIAIAAAPLSPEQMQEMERKAVSAAAGKELTLNDDGKEMKRVFTINRKITGAEPGVSVGTDDHSFVFMPAAASKYETRTEELGTRVIEGVTAEGTRRVTTIPEGAIGNERPIEITYERWYSKELGLLMYTKQVDPRFGEQTYRVSNLVRSEPDASLFTVPERYRRIQSGPGVYKIQTKPAAPARALRPAKPATPAAVNVNN